MLMTVSSSVYKNILLLLCCPFTGEPVLYCTSFVRGSSSDDGTTEVDLQNGPFRFLEQNYTSIFVSLPSLCFH